VVAVRIAVVAGRNVIGIEVPNAKRETVYLSELLGAESWEAQSGALSLALGKDISGAPVVADLARMPHLLIAGTTGSGKSVGVNAMIISLLYRLSPEQCRLILIDPKILELSVYDGIPHLLTPVVTEPPKAVAALKWVVREMDRRYRNMSQLSVRNIAGYNERVNEARGRGEVVTRRVQTGFDSETGKPVFEDQPLALEPLPFIVVFIDEMADLMVTAGKEIEICVQRLAQKARAAGIHVIMATQRPSVDVITGTIKANFPTRISFQVISKFDSRTILGEQGAEQLLGQGDLLYMQGGGRITRVHGPFVSDQEVEAMVEYLREQGEPAYLDEVTEPSEDEEGAAATPGSVGGNTNSENALYDQAVAIVARDRKASTSYLQRCLTIGYNRAAKLIEQMEKDGIVSPANHVGKREVLVRPERDDA
jgi:S-DNA-T family DNA segregation ATPase FtsK/SpoIIIE